MRCRPAALLLLAAACGAPPGPTDDDARAWITNDTGLHVERRGPSSAADVAPLLVPGAVWLDRDLEPLAERLALVFVDLAGRGRSSAHTSPADASIEEDLADLEAMRELLGIERASLLGWSYFGGLAVRYALRHPERVERLVLVAPLPPRRSPHWPAFVRRFGDRVDSAALEELDALRAAGLPRSDPDAFCDAFTRVYLRTYCADPAAAARVRSDPCQAPNLDPDVAGLLGQSIVTALGDWDWRAELAALDVPVLIVHGTEDPVPIEGSREYAAVLPYATLLELPDTGHLPWVESPAEFFPPVLAFLAPE